MTVALPETSEIPKVANNSPAAHAIAVDISSTDDTLDEPARGLFVGNSGDVIVGMVADSATQITFKNVPSGTLLPIGAKIIYKTGTTATDIVAVW